MKKFVTFSVLLGILATNTFAQNTTFPNNVGIGTTTPGSYYHGGTNRVLEIHNEGTASNSQSHVILSTGATNNLGSVGSISWMTANSTSNTGVAYIGAQITKDASANASGAIVFATADASIPLEKMRLNASGSLGIGTADPGEYKLAVEGIIGARRVKVTKQTWADFVFNSAYKLPSLQYVEAFVKQHNHLPEIPSASEIEQNGLDLGSMQQKQMQKIEELTLYLIDLNKKLEAQQQVISVQQKEIQQLKKHLQK